MEPYALKHAIAEMEVQLKGANFIQNYDGNQMIDWAFKILQIAELKQLNKNLERLTGYLQGK